MTLDAYKRFVAKAERSTAYWQEIGLSEFLESLLVQMQRKGMRPADVARALKVSPGYVSRVLNGEENLTLATLVRFARTVDGVLHLHVSDRNSVTRWEDVDYGTSDTVSAVTMADRG